MVLIHPDALAHQSTQAPIVSAKIIVILTPAEMHHSSTYTCSCPSTFIGTHCDYRVGWFQVYARYGRGLSDQDGWWAGYSDPYLGVTVYDYLEFQVRRLTHYVAENRNPVWNQRLYLHAGVHGGGLPSESGTVIIMCKPSDLEFMIWPRQGPAPEYRPRHRIAR